MSRSPAPLPPRRRAARWTALGLAATLGLAPPAHARQQEPGSCAPAAAAAPSGRGDAHARAPQQHGLRLLLNIPARRLEVFEGNERTRSYPVAVGTPAHPTPTGEFAISLVVWNPWWYPPPSDWARNEKPVPPGPNNPMGRVKLRFDDLYYIHGTPDPSSIGRAASHGCVRMSNRDVVELARLVHRYASPDLSAARRERIATDRRNTHTVPLALPVPLEVVYRLVEVRAGRLEIHPDIYRRARRPLDEQVVEALSRAGYDPAALDPEKLGTLLRKAARGSVSAPIHELLREPLPPIGG
jgi:hypothetical protein